MGEQQEPFPSFLPLFLPKNSYSLLTAADSSGSSTLGPWCLTFLDLRLRGAGRRRLRLRFWKAETQVNAQVEAAGAMLIALLSAGTPAVSDQKLQRTEGDTCSSCSLGRRVCRNPGQEVLPKP